jgi:hypothetical protein
MEELLTKIDGLVPKDHWRKLAWSAWHARLLYDVHARAHLPEVCKALFSEDRRARRPWALALFRMLSLK